MIIQEPVQVGKKYKIKMLRNGKVMAIDFLCVCVCVYTCVW